MYMTNGSKNPKISLLQADAETCVISNGAKDTL